MQRPEIFQIGDQRIRFYPTGKLDWLHKILPDRRLILITDRNVYRNHRSVFSRYDTIALHPGEQYKVQQTVDGLIDRLIEWQADRQTLLVGVGGGVVTDLVGYLASVYMRGVEFGLVPTTLLSMVDASIGGKNGVDVGQHKNLVGTVRQPVFILHDHRFLSTLPKREWSNGFAEIIKHAAIGDAKGFRELVRNDLSVYQHDYRLLLRLIRKNVRFKFDIVKKDPFEQGHRKILNFGHTLGHALEMHYELSHGEAISLGMMFAAHLSERMCSFSDAASLAMVLQQYGLPLQASFAVGKVFRSMSMDKKRSRSSLDFILLKRIGEAERRLISLKELEKQLRQYL